jgi:hypothetical protein
MHLQLKRTFQKPVPIGTILSKMLITLSHKPMEQSQAANWPVWLTLVRMKCCESSLETSPITIEIYHIFALFSSKDSAIVGMSVPTGFYQASLC